MNSLTSSPITIAVLINSTNVISTLGQIAHKKLIAVAFASTLADYRLDIDLNEVLEKLKPTVKRVLSIIDCDDKTAPSLKHLQRYIREMDQCTLRTFLRFTTASDLMLLDGHTEYHRLTVRWLTLRALQGGQLLIRVVGYWSYRKITRVFRNSNRSSVHFSAVTCG